MDSPGLAVMLSTVAQQQTSIAADLGAIRTDIARVATRVEVAESERKIASATQTDHETRIRALERWRYALPTSVILGIGSAVLGVIAVWHH